MSRITLFLAMLFGLVLSASAHTPQNPNFLNPELFKDWKVLKTEHFRVNHEAKDKEYARRMATIAEKVHGKLSKWLGYSPKGITEVVMLDSIDTSNGGATPLPYNQFYIYMPVPTDSTIMDHNPWIEMVFTHEYIHILQLDMVYGAPKAIRSIFGRMQNIFTWAVFPQLFAPSWVTEGIATYGESDNPYGYGRLNNAIFPAMMRMEVDRGLLELTEVSYEGYSGSRWPNGLIYLYGAYFYKFIEEKYGKSKVAYYQQVYANNIIPWRMDNRSHKVFGKSGKVVWVEFQQYLNNKFKAQLTEIKQRGEYKTRIVIDEPYINSQITATDNGDLIYNHNSYSSYPSVRRVNAQGEVETLFGALGVSHLDWHGKQGLLMSKFEVCDNVNLYTDLYIWKEGESSPDRITECGRYPTAVWNKHGSAIAATELDRGKTHLVVLDALGQNPQRVASMLVGNTIGQLNWSPDGKEIVASVKREKTGWNLELFNVEKKQWRFLTRNKDREVRPDFTQDGKSVYFLSDHDGVWNLRVLNLKSGKVKTMSNTLSLISQAAEMPNGSYRLMEYAADSFNITALDNPQAQGKSYPAISAEQYKVTSILTDKDYAPIAYENVDDYSIWSSLYPRSWFPLLSITEDDNSFVGVTLNGADVLGFHEWSLVPLYYYDLGEAGGVAAYSFYNKLLFTASRDFVTTGDVDSATRFLEEENHTQVLLNHYFDSLYSTIYVAAGTANEKIVSTLVKGTGNEYETKDNITGAILSYDSTEFYRRSISLVDGRNIELVWETYDAFDNSDHSGQTYRIDWSEYIGLGANHVLKLHGIYAEGDDGIRPYSLGGEFDAISTLGGFTRLGRRKFALRGYKNGAPGLVGSNMAVVSAEWRIPLGLVYDGFFVPPFGMGRHSMNVFVDSGDAWDQNQQTKFKTGAGLEYNIETLIGYDLIHLGISVGYAHGFDQGGDDLAYLRLGFPVF